MGNIRAPFRPSFGVTPPFVAGRESIVDQVELGLKEGPGSRHRATLLVAPRGTGKTVLLNQIEDRALEMGWYVCDLSAKRRFRDELVNELIPMARRYLDLDEATPRRLTGASFLGTKLSFEPEATLPPVHGLRHDLTAVVDALEARGSGLLITIDEVNPATLQDLAEIASVYQHIANGEGRELAFVGAGIPGSVHALLSKEGSTFLQRAHRPQIDLLSPRESRAALRTPIIDNDRTIDADALDYLVDLSGGYPFAIQVLGYEAWNFDPSNPVISLADAKISTVHSESEIASQVHEPTMRELGGRSLEYLTAVAEQEVPASTGRIVEQLGRTAGYWNVYRDRLIKRGLIRAAHRGHVEIALPFLRAHIRQQHTLADLVDTAADEARKELDKGDDT